MAIHRPSPAQVWFVPDHVQAVIDHDGLWRGKIGAINKAVKGPPHKGGAMANPVKPLFPAPGDE